MTETTTRPRVRRTPAEIAQAELAAARARATKAKKALTEAEVTVKAANAEWQRAERLAIHAAEHPDLPDA